MDGSVKFFSEEIDPKTNLPRHYGFIYGEDGKEYHFHLHDVLIDKHLSGRPSSRPMKGDHVKFEPDYTGPKMKARRVSIQSAN